MDKNFIIFNLLEEGLANIVISGLKDFIKFVYTRVGNILRFVDNDISDFSQFGDNSFVFTLAKEYVLYYPVNQNENVYKQIEQDPNQINKLRQEFLNAYNTYIAILSQ